MFRGKESSNRIELSQLVQDLLNFGVLGSLQLCGCWVVGWCPPHMCTCMRMHACTCACGKHDYFMQMAASIGFLENPWEFPMMSYTCMCVCAHACAHVWGAPSHHPHPIHPTPRLQGGTLRISQNSIVLELIEIFQLFEDLKSVETSPPMGGSIVWWMGGWVDGWGQVKTLKILKTLT